MGISAHLCETINDANPGINNSFNCLQCMPTPTSLCTAVSKALFEMNWKHFWRISVKVHLYFFLLIWNNAHRLCNPYVQHFINEMCQNSKQVLFGKVLDIPLKSWACRCPGLHILFIGPKGFASSYPSDGWEKHFQNGWKASSSWEDPREVVRED